MKNRLKNLGKFALTLTIYLLPVLICGRNYNPRFVFSNGILVHLLMYISFVMIMMITSKKARLSFVVINLLEYAFATISYLKVETRCQIFEPWDLVFSTNLGDFSNFMDLNVMNYINIVLELFITCLVTVYQIYVFEKYCEVPRKIKGICILIFSIIIPIIFINSYLDFEMKYVYSNMNGKRNYSRYRTLAEYGALCNFLLDIGIMDIGEATEEYSYEKIKEIYNEYEDYKISQNLEEYDNVIVILMESYVDLEKLDEISFEKDLLDNYHKYMNEGATGNLSVPNIGGGTANTEYKAITMFSTDQYPTGIYPYMHCVNNDISVLPRIFKENGYNTTGIHTYNEGFYSRYKAYPLIGFDEFISDDDFENPEYYGQYISDMEIYNLIVNKIEQEDKSYITASTMGTHAPYSNFSFDEYEEYIECDKLSEGEELALNNYLQEIRVLDEMLGKLIEYIKTSDEKTLLIVYGDHYPMIYQIFEKLGVIETNENNISVEEYPELFITPYLVISNCQEIESKGNLEPSELGGYILENVKLNNLPWWYKVVHKHFETGEAIDDYEMIQYDEIFGQKYWKNF